VREQREWLCAASVWRASYGGWKTKPHLLIPEEELAAVQGTGSLTLASGQTRSSRALRVTSCTAPDGPSGGGRGATFRWSLFQGGVGPLQSLAGCGRPRDDVIESPETGLEVRRRNSRESSADGPSSAAGRPISAHRGRSPIQTTRPLGWRLAAESGPPQLLARSAPMRYPSGGQPLQTAPRGEVGVSVGQIYQLVRVASQQPSTATAVECPAPGL